MKIPSFYTDGYINELLHTLATYHNQLIQTEQAFTRSMLFTEDEIKDLLLVSSRTMRTYRKKGYFRHIKIEGRVYYLKVLFYIDLLKRCEESH